MLPSLQTAGFADGFARTTVTSDRTHSLAGPSSPAPRNDPGYDRSHLTRIARACRSAGRLDDSLDAGNATEPRSNGRTRWRACLANLFELTRSIGPDEDPPANRAKAG